MTRNGSDTKVCASTTAVVVNAIRMPAALRYSPISPSLPNAYSSAMPPTTGGSTSGNKISGLAMRTTRTWLRASTIAIGTPSSRHRAVLAAAVLRLSTRAVVDDSLEINDQKLGQSTLAATAISGTTTNSAPIAAGTYIQRGSTDHEPMARTPNCCRVEFHALATVQ